MAKSDDKADVWMPLYIGDYLADTSRLTTEQHGAYLLLIMDYWRNGPPPDDEEILQNVTRLSKFLWKKHGPVLQKFFTVENGVWRHKRIDEEMAGAASGKAAASEKARIAANARWGKTDAPSNAQAHAPEMLEDCPSQSPSPSPTKTLEEQQQASTVEAPTQTPNGSSPASRSVEIATYLRQRGVAGANSFNPNIAAWGDDVRVTDEILEAALSKARSSLAGKPVGPNYLAPIVLDLLNPKPAQPQKQRDDWNRSPKGIERKASELGIYARPGENHDALRERCESELRRRAQGVAA